MDKHSIPITDFRIMQRQERRKWTAGGIGAIIGAASAWFLIPNMTAAALVSGAGLGAFVVCGLQVMRIYLGELMFEESGNRRP